MNPSSRILAVLIFALTAAPVWAAPVSFSADHVDIQYDDESSYFGSIVSTYSGTVFNSWLLPSGSFSGDGLNLLPGLSYAAGGSGYADTGYLGFELFGFAFQPHAGWQIDGYHISFSGMIESSGDGSYLFDATQGSYSVVGNQYTFDSGPMAVLPNVFIGRIALDAPYVEEPDGTASVYGTAMGSIERIRIEALVSPVPEPETWALLGMGAALLALRRPGPMHRRWTPATAA